MVGRTPEFLGKKIEPYEMEVGGAGLPGHPIAIPVGSGLAAVCPVWTDA